MEIECYYLLFDWLRWKKEKTTVKYISSTTPYNFAEANVYVLDLDGARWNPELLMSLPKYLISDAVN